MDAALGATLLLIKLIEPVQQLAQSVTGKEGSMLHPVIKPLRHGHRPLPANGELTSRVNDLLARQGAQPVDWRLP
jgi:hypothetical protein